MAVLIESDGIYIETVDFDSHGDAWKEMSRRFTTWPVENETVKIRFCDSERASIVTDKCAVTWYIYNANTKDAVSDDLTSLIHMIRDAHPAYWQDDSEYLIRKDITSYRKNHGITAPIYAYYPDFEDYFKSWKSVGMDRDEAKQNLLTKRDEFMFLPGIFGILQFNK